MSTTNKAIKIYQNKKILAILKEKLREDFE